MIPIDVSNVMTACVLAFVASAVVAPGVYRLLKRVGSRQKISEHIGEHAHKEGTPTMGGLIVLLALLAVFILVPFHDGLVPAVLLLGFAFIGLLDDFIVPRLANGARGLGWKQKLGLQILVTVGACWLGGVRDWQAMAVIVFFILFFANAFNISDGMDTLAGGLGVLMALGFGVIALLVSYAPAAILMAALAGAMLPFLFLNAPPAKLFMGDVGALPIGALLGWAFLVVGRSSEIYPAHQNLWAASIIAGVMAIELVPVPLQILSAKLRGGKRLFPKTPLHHGLQEAGWPETRVVWTFHLVQAVLVLAGLAVVLGVGR
ncbi:MAG: hypothetical protein IH944_02160 [Armatimonadetes bacterium]|nr:hypothetical protein [Armatimonadota bacterium]